MINYNQIDLDKVREKVGEFASIDDSKLFIMSEDVPFNPLQIKRNLNETKELLNLMTSKNFNLSFDGIENISDILIKAKKEITLNSFECAKVLNFHNHCARIKNVISKIEGELDIKDYVDSIFVDSILEKEVSKVVDNSGNIKDDASEKLAFIIHEIDNNEKFLYNAAHNFINRYSQSLQEPSIYLRNNRVVFLIKNSDKNKFNGFTYGTSASGMASYVEPEALVVFNNKKLSLEDDKEDEINRLLLNLTYIISDRADHYLDNYDSLVKLDVVYAKASYGYKNACCIPCLSDELNLKEICHPLIDQNKVVSNTYTLMGDYKGIVISGTNTGGKTVGLKVIGLSVLMAYLGIPVIATSAKIPLYSNVYVDIDDNQSIYNSLSTFSAHLSNINEILNKADSKSLILIDELISGTDPKEAQAISLAILNRILEIGSSFVITTHYDDIKNFSYKNPNILLSSVGFDYETLTPTYKYLENSVGVSNAIDIAERYIDNKNLINYAREIIKNSSSKEEELLQKLAKEIEENEILKEELSTSIEENFNLHKELEQKTLKFEEEKETLKRQYIEKLNNEIEEIKQKALDKLESISDIKHTKVVEEIEELKDNTFVEEKEEVVYEIGDNVRVNDTERIGKIISIKGDRAEVDLNGLTIKTDINSLKKMPKTVKKEIRGETKRNYKKISKELNIVGKRVEEGLVELESYLDAALLNNYSSVKIIHGLGTGQLKNAVRERLKKMKFVKSYGNGDYHDGGGAVTIVVLK